MQLGHGRARPDGRQPRPPADARRPPLRRSTTSTRTPSRSSTARARPAPTSLDDFVAEAGQAAGRVAHAAGGDRRARRSTSSCRCSTPTTPSSTAATPTTATTSRAAKRLAASSIHYVDCGTQRRGVGAGARLLPDDRRRGRRGRAARPDLQDHRPGRGQRRADAGPDPTRRHRARRATCTAARAAPATS